MTNSDDLVRKFQDKLSCCLLTIFCPKEGLANVSKRFWDHLSLYLYLFLLNGAYSSLNHGMQVMNHPSSTCTCTYMQSVHAYSLEVCWSADYALFGDNSRLDLTVI